ncbi:hypothetical protein PMI14_02085 [Acidovorax sp. CF316]|nr:hypothetical protein PMI14_02085 [Acidovorax sp. CF316]
MDSPASYAVVRSQLAELPIFIERNARGHNMYSNALARFASYLDEGIHGDVGQDIEIIMNDPAVGATEKVELVKARIGQGAFRQKLLLHWDGCAVTGYKELTMLVASHVKAWSASSNAERLDPFNGLLLSPNLDRAFDRGFITFDKDGAMEVSPLLSEPQKIGIVPGMRVALQPKHQPYMEHHRDVVYLSK